LAHAVEFAKTMSRPIADLAFLSDMHSAALVDRSGSIEWWCLPHFSSPSVFGRILDPEAGHFRVAPTLIEAVERRYLDDSLVLRTTFRTPTGALELTDTLAMAEGVRGHDVGRGSPHLILRLARCTEGDVDLEVDFVPRFEYGLTTPIVQEVDGVIVSTGGPTTLSLDASIDLSVEGARASGRSRLHEGETATFALHGVHTWHPDQASVGATAVEDRLTDTVDAWQTWAATHRRYEGPYAELVAISGRVLHGLTFHQTGAMVAAATTSLPESVGGERNWDYRYAWIRDASITLDALRVSACPDEASDFLTFLTRAASSIYGKRHIQIMFGVRGERDLTERELPWLRGWRDSRPVRVGNGAWTQPQLDVYGEILDAVHRQPEVIEGLPDQQRLFLRTLADRAAEGWEDTDHGIWEMRGPRQHFVHSKLMTWVALDRAIDMAGRIGAEDRVEEWTSVRELVRETIEDQGWNEEVGAFVQAYGSNELDASNLLIPIMGFLPPNDPRVLATIDRTAEGLTDERGLVMRYKGHDGLEGIEGSFLICTFWLVEAQARAGRLGAARELFERATGYANDLGLLSEEIETATGELIGNFPQAFSHAGLINAAVAIREAESNQQR
jgi:GH15 family glucan-1,4-alpha-glucosidase